MYFMGSFTLLHTFFVISDIKRPDYDKAVKNLAFLSSILSKPNSFSLTGQKFIRVLHGNSTCDHCHEISQN